MTVYLPTACHTTFICCYSGIIGTMSSSLNMISNIWIALLCTVQPNIFPVQQHVGVLCERGFQSHCHGHGHVSHGPLIPVPSVGSALECWVKKSFGLVVHIYSECVAKINILWLWLWLCTLSATVLKDNTQTIYAELWGKLHTHHAHVAFFLLACNSEPMRLFQLTLLNFLELRPKAQENVLKIAIRNMYFIFNYGGYQAGLSYCNKSK